MLFLFTVRRQAENAWTKYGSVKQNLTCKNIKLLFVKLGIMHMKHDSQASSPFLILAQNLKNCIYFLDLRRTPCDFKRIKASIRFPCWTVGFSVLLYIFTIGLTRTKCLYV